MISQLEFDPGDYHLRVMIEQMERDGRSEHAIVKAVRAASDASPAAELPRPALRSGKSRARLHPLGATPPAVGLASDGRRRALPVTERRRRWRRH